MPLKSGNSKSERMELRGMDALQDYLAYHRIAWVRELPPGTMLADKLAGAVTGIAIAEVKG